MEQHIPTITKEYIQDTPRARRPAVFRPFFWATSLRGQWLITAIACLIVVGFFAVYSTLSESDGIDHVMRDAQSRHGASPFTALGSDLGMYCWVSAIALGTYSLIIAAKRGGGPRAHVNYLYSLIGLTLLLLIDDRLMFHEYYFPQVWGLSENTALFAIMGAAGLFFVLAFRWHHLGGWPFLLTSMVLFASSLAVDQTTPAQLENHIGQIAEFVHYLAEDGLKLSGIIFWLIFVARVSTRLIHEADTRRMQS